MKGYSCSSFCSPASLSPTELIENARLDSHLGDHSRRVEVGLPGGEADDGHAGLAQRGGLVGDGHGLGRAERAHPRVDGRVHRLRPHRRHPGLAFPRLLRPANRRDQQPSATTARRRKVGRGSKRGRCCLLVRRLTWGMKRSPCRGRFWWGG